MSDDDQQDNGDSSSFRERAAELAKTLPAERPTLDDYRPMKDAYVPEPEKEKEISKDDLRRAASNLNEEHNRVEQKPIVERSYQYFGGDRDGEAVAPNETLTLDRAARDLTRQRDAEAAAAQEADDQFVAATVDLTRADVLQPQAQQPQQQDQPQQQAPQVDVQPQQQAPASDEEMLRSALERPAVRQALEQQIGQLEQARASYAQQAGAAFDLSFASLMSAYPELQSVTPGSLPAVMQAIQKVDPVRHANILNALNSTDRLHRTATEAKAQEAQIAQARQKMWSDGEDKRFAEQVLSREPKETVDAVVRNGARILQSYGISPGDLQNLAATNPALRSVAGQQVLYDLIKSKLAAENLAQKRVPPTAPPVLRPGAARPTPSYTDEVESSALKAFTRNPTPKSAAAYLNAKRAARR